MPVAVITRRDHVCTSAGIHVCLLEATMAFEAPLFGVNLVG
jgi:hypothetical protein